MEGSMTLRATRLIFDTAKNLNHEQQKLLSQLCLAVMESGRTVDDTVAEKLVEITKTTWVPTPPRVHEVKGCH